MDFNFTIIILFASFLLENVYSKKKEGDFCFIRALNKNGVCTLISSCPSAMEYLEMEITARTISPQQCGFKNRVPVVCCENDDIPEVTTALPITTSENHSLSTEETRTTPLIQVREMLPPITNWESIFLSETTQTEMPQIGEKSEQKCKEYFESVYFPPRIDGGTPAKLKEFPHMALIGYERDSKVYWKCGGSLISDKYVLTAAHCTFIKDYGISKHILLGELILNSETDSAQPQQIPIKRSIPHYEYVHYEHYNDIALLELEHNAVLNTYVNPACLNTNPDIGYNLSVASGWGQGLILKKVVLDMFTNDECNFVYGNFRDIHLIKGIDKETQICAGSRNGSRDTCYGDSGGPLQIIKSEDFGMHVILGIISFGLDCGASNNPAVYTKVSSYIKWIEDIVWP